MTASRVRVELTKQQAERVLAAIGHALTYYDHDIVGAGISLNPEEATDRAVLDRAAAKFRTALYGGH